MNAQFTSALLAVVLAIGGCADKPTDKVSDQCLRVQLFQQCLKALPAGPTSTHYNDWDEVVNTCGSQAYYQSIRPRAAVAPACVLDR